MTEQNAAANPNAEVDLVAELREHAANLQLELNVVKSQNGQFKNGMRLTAAQNRQLSANVGVLRSQRDAFLEREADALVNLALSQEDNTALVAAHENQLESAGDEAAVLSGKLKQQQAALDEVRAKFGHVQHARKVAVKELETLKASQALAEDAVIWYVATSDKSRRAIGGAYEKATGNVISMHTLVTAFAVVREHELVVTSADLVEFLVNPRGYIEAE